MIDRYKGTRKNRQRAVALFATFALGPNLVACSPETKASNECLPISRSAEGIRITTSEVVCNLGSLAVKGRAPKNDYDRDAFGTSWTSVKGCDTREKILRRDLTDATVGAKCNVESGTLYDPYTGATTTFSSSKSIQAALDIDHVVALGDAWQKGANQWDRKKRKEFANDGLNLLAVDASANRQKGDNDVSGWEPSNKSRLCEYVTRQVLIKEEYDLSVTAAEHNRMDTILTTCPGKTFVITD
jgi:hypothetical protein